MQKNTKTRILDTAIALFNRFGYVNVRLQHIADEANLSIGNLAYHFKTKDDILETIYQQIEIEQKNLLAELRIVPLFLNIDTHLKNTFEIQSKYSFFYSDTFEILRAFPIIKRNYREYTRWYITQIEIMLQYNVFRGVFIEEKIEGLYKQLAIHYWTTTELWLYQNRVRGSEEITEEHFRMAIWALLIPYFTEVGQKEYEQIDILGNINLI
jgi:AcrR family transcriptional regulator